MAGSETAVAAIDKVLDKLSSCLPTNPAKAEVAKNKLGCVASEDQAIKVSAKYRVDAKNEMAQIESALEKAIHRWSNNSAKDAQDALEGKTPAKIKDMTLAQKVGEFQRLYNLKARQDQLGQLSAVLGLTDEHNAVKDNLKVDRLPGIKTLSALKFVTEVFDAQAAREKGVAAPAKVNSAPESSVEKAPAAPAPAPLVASTPAPVIAPKLSETITDSKGNKFELGLTKEEVALFDRQKSALSKEGFQIGFGTNPKAPQLKTISLLSNDGKQELATADLAEPLARGQVNGTIKELVDTYKAKEQANVAARAEVEAQQAEIKTRTAKYLGGSNLVESSIVLPDLNAKNEFDALIKKRTGVGQNYSVEVTEKEIILSEKKNLERSVESIRSFKGAKNAQGIKSIESQIASHEASQQRKLKDIEAKTLKGEILGSGFVGDRDKGIQLPDAATKSAALDLMETYKKEFLVRLNTGKDRNGKSHQYLQAARVGSPDVVEVILDGVAAVKSLEAKMVAAKKAAEVKAEAPVAAAPSPVAPRQPVATTAPENSLKSTFTYDLAKTFSDEIKNGVIKVDGNRVLFPKLPLERGKTAFLNFDTTKLEGKTTEADKAVFETFVKEVQAKLGR